MSYKPIYYNSKTRFIFLGNGLNRAFQKTNSWDELVKIKQDKVPYQLLLSLDQNTSKKDICSSLLSTNISSSLQEIINKLVFLGFTDFLTTNYSFEIEYSLLEKKNRNINYIKSHTFTLIDRKVNSGYQPFVYIEVPYKGKFIRVFHIHGDCARPSSIVLKQSEYASCIGKSFALTGYEAAFKLDKLGYERSGFRYKSWVDFFILNDILILGYGLSFYEFDIWTAIEKRYTANKFYNKIRFLNLFGDELSEEQKFVFHKYGIIISKPLFSSKEEASYKLAYTTLINSMEDYIK